VSTTDTRLKFVRRALRVALCYLVVLQAFVATYSAAFAVSQASGTVAGFAICHSGGGAAQDSPGPAAPASIPCALCAMAASAGGLPPAPGTTVVAPPSVAGRVRPADISVIASPQPARAGLARAPPQFA
jgi:hypothetical protein